MPTTIAVYLRDAPGCPIDAAAQLAAIRAYADRQGWTIATVYQDRAPPNGNSRARRSGRDALLRDAGTKFDAVVVTHVSMLGRTLPDLIATLAALAERGVTVNAVNGHGDAMEALMAALPALATVHAQLRQEAVMAGKARARARGVRFGRPPVDPAKANRVITALAKGAGIRPAARAAGVSPATVLRIKNQPIDRAAQ